MLARFGLGDGIDRVALDTVSNLNRIPQPSNTNIDSTIAPVVLTNTNASVPGSAPAIGYGYPGVVPITSFLSNSNQNLVYASPLDVNSIQSQLAALQSNVTNSGYGTGNNFLTTVETFIQNNPMLSVGIGGIAAYLIFGKSGRR